MKPVTIKNFPKKAEEKAKAGELVAPMRYVYDPEGIVLRFSPNDWDRDERSIAAVGISHRSTTSSRRPGRAIEGSVHFKLRKIGTCPTCGSATYFPAKSKGEPHCWWWGRTATGAACKIGCDGKEITT